MLTHGFGPSFSFDPKAIGFRRAIKPGADASNFLRPPNPDEVFTGGGISGNPGRPPLIDPSTGEVNDDFHRLMARLAARIGRREEDTFWANGLQDGLERWENPTIPSGYTYLLQLVAHDLVDSVATIAVEDGR